jgi:small-conductance mechanosensitive channel
MWDMYSNYIDMFTQSLVKWADLHLVNIVIILVGTYALRVLGIRLISDAAKHTLRHDLFPTRAERIKRAETLRGLIKAGVRIGTWLLAIVMIVSELGINTAPLLASAGILGVAFGFGAQSLVKDFVNGIFIITENQYRVGDIVNIGEVSGIVEALTIRSTVLRDIEGNLHYVPNGTITVTTNRTNKFSRMSEDIVVSANSDIDKLEHIISHIGEQLAAKPEFQNKIIDPPKLFQVTGLENGGIGIKVLATVTEGEQWNLKSEFYRLLVKAAKQHDISLITNQQITVSKPST